FTAVQLEGLDVEPSVITDYKGVTALAFHVGTATGSDGKQYNLETDLRAMEGSYVAEDGSRKRGLFALIRESTVSGQAAAPGGAERSRVVSVRSGWRRVLV